MSPNSLRNILPSLALCAITLLGPEPAAAGVCPQASGFQTPIYVGQPNRPRMTVVADVNQDGIPDLVVTYSETGSGNANSIGVMLGNGSGGSGDGTFQAPVQYTTGSRPFRLVVADFDGDGLPDIVTGNWASNTVSFLHGVGNGTFGARVDFPAGPNPYGLTSGDFNHDGALDLAVSENGSNQVAVLMGGMTAGHGNGTFLPPVPYTIQNLSTSILAADLNQDGNLDLVATSNFSNTVTVLLGQANGTFVSNGNWLAGTEPYALAAQDFNGDGKLDLAVSCTNHSGVFVLLGNGGGGFQAPVGYVPGVNGGDILALDLDGDGIRDLAFTFSDGNQVVTLHGNGTGGVGNGTFSPRTTTPVFNFPVGLAALDLNHDGFPDLVAGSYLSLQLAFLSSTCVAPPPTPGAPVIVGVHDVPNDQGGKVFVTWSASSFDAITASVTSYRVWRRIPATQAPAAAMRLARGETTVRATRGAGPDGAAIIYWEAAAVLPAQRLPGYGYTSATPQDSMASGNPYTAFFITAATSNPDVFYDSPVDSGYSVDNLAPAAPAAFAAVYQAGQVHLHWIAGHEADLAGYDLFRGLSPTFVPGPGNLLHAANDTAYIDVTNGLYTYKLAAVDVHGNLSPVLAVSPQSPTAAELSLVAAVWADGAARLDWYVDAAVVTRADVQRFDGAGWITLATLLPDGSGHMIYADASIPPGTARDYRLQWVVGSETRHGGEASVTSPALRLAFRGAQPNPLRGRDGALAFSLPHEGPATLAIYDMAGRRIVTRDVGTLGAGERRIALAELRLPAGVYLARLSQGATSAGGRFVILE